MDTKSENPNNIDEVISPMQIKAFSAQMNPHFVFNALNAIQGFITSGNKKASLYYLSVFSKLIRYYLKNIDKETVLLREEREMLNSYLTLQKLRYGNKFDYSLEEDEGTEYPEASIPSFILQTLLENTIEHAIYNQYSNYTLEIAFKTSAKQVLVTLVFNYEESSSGKPPYVPDYRKQLIKWQDQIRQLNSCKNYKIKKKITFNKNCDGKGGKITLSLPNLMQ